MRLTIFLIIFVVHSKQRDIQQAGPNGFCLEFLRRLVITQENIAEVKWSRALPELLDKNNLCSSNELTLIFLKLGLLPLCLRRLDMDNIFYSGVSC